LLTLIAQTALDLFQRQVGFLPNQLSLEKATESYSRLLGNPSIHRNWKML
jgi:hypothetical protein